MTEPLPSSHVLGRYELLHLLGQGGMGEVHLARSQGAAGFEKLCIVKTILPQQGKDPQFIERFLHEARVLVQLTHSNIAQVYDMGDATGQLFMSIEYVAGVDLARLEWHAWSEGAQIPVPVALYIGQRIAEALGYAHRKTGPDGAPLGIVHRDVSPQNVMVSYEGDVKVIDFGLAKSAARSKQTQPSTVLGKFGYLSPEQARADRVDFHSDIYSCGIVVWELLAGRPLFETGSVGEMLAKMMNPQIPSLHQLRPDVSEELARVVERALAVNPSDRYARADDFARALNERGVKDGISVSAEDVGSYVRERCATEFAEHRKLTSRLSSITRPVSGISQVGMEATAIRRTPEPATPQPPAPSAPAALAALAVVPAAPLAVASAAPVEAALVAVAPVAALPVAMPSAPLAPNLSTPPAPQAKSQVGLVVALVVGLILVLGLGVWGGMHLRGGSAAPPPAAVAVAPAVVPVPAAAVPTAAVPAAVTPPPSTEPVVASADSEQDSATNNRRRRRRRALRQAAAADLEVPAAVPMPVAAPVKPLVPPPVPKLVASAELSGAGPWKHVSIENRGDIGWTKCELRLPDNRHALLDELEAHDSESINMMKFKQDGPELDRDLDWVNVRCAEGTARLRFK